MSQQKNESRKMSLFNRNRKTGERGLCKSDNGRSDEQSE